MTSFKHFLRWYNNKDVVSPMEATHKPITFWHQKNVVMLKLGSTIPNLSNNCLHKPTDTEIYPIAEADKNLKEKNREDVVCGSVVLTGKAVVGDTFVRKSTKLRNSLLRLMLATYSPTRCVKTCRLVFTRVETSVH